MCVVNMDASCTHIISMLHLKIVHLCFLALILIITSPFGICSTESYSSHEFDEITCIPSERDALLKFKHHLVDPSNRLSSWNASNPNCCHWYGIVCSNVTAHVLQLHLNTSYPAFDAEAYEANYRRSVFGGKIYHSLVDLKHLSYLNLSGNDFGGMQIPSFLCSVTSLTYLDLSGAGFYGKIPPQIGNLSNLLYLDLAFSVHGTIPYQTGNLTNLLHLDLQSYYDYDEPLDEPLVAESLGWLSSFSSLQYLDLSRANLSESIDWLQTMQALPSLVELRLDGCTLNDYNQPSTLNFSSLVSLSIPLTSKWIFGLKQLVSLQSASYFVIGTIPDGIQNLTLLENLDLRGSYFSSSIPNWLYSLHHLKFLNLRDNNFGGTISDGVGNLTSLISLDLSNTQLQGVIPNSMGKLTSLVRLNLSNNLLEGVIPNSMGNLTSLISLDLSNTQLQGVIPNFMGKLTSLVILDLSNNLLEGVIPTFLGNLTSLIKLDLSRNQLEGPIPISFGNLSSMIYLDLSKNQLKGVIPTSFKKLCNLKWISFSYLKSNQQISEILEIFTPCVSLGLLSLTAHSCQISGHFTDQLGMFRNLVALDFHNNSMLGALPRTLGKLSSLTFLDLSNNKLNGNPFESLSSLSNLLELDIADNLFQGVVNETNLANFANLRVFSASGNSLTLKVGPNWQPSFQIQVLGMNSWKLGPSFPSWIKSQKGLFSLDISSTSISDSMPTWFQRKIRFISYLNLSHNHIQGELSNTLNSHFVETTIDLSSNHLHGKLLYLPVGLYWLDLSSNSFSGSITDFICQQKDNTDYFFFLNLASNNLSGEIPDCWGTWLSLVDVNLESNRFIGNLPSSMASLSNLQSLRLRNNMLSGKFPLILKNTSQLISLDLGENNLTGSIPTWIGERLPSLKVLRLRSNKFSRHIPNGICDMKFLQDLDLAQNSLSGNIPSCFDRLAAMIITQSHSSSFIYTKMNTADVTGKSIISVLVWVKGSGVEYANILGLVKSIDLSDNKLSGEIPEEITKLLGLIYLNLSKNVLSGQIPQGIGNMASLESIDFSRNHLSGEIPPTITNLSFLNKLDVSYNHLKGQIPTSTQLQSFNASGFVGNDLCGPPSLVNCSSPGKIHNADHNDEDDEGHGVKWFLVSMALGFIVGLWGVVGSLVIYKSWRYAYFRFLDDMWYKLQSFW